MTFILGLGLGLAGGYYLAKKGVKPIIADAKALLAKLRKKQ